MNIRAIPMNIKKSLTLALLLGCVLVAHAQDLSRNYKVGDVDRYKMTFNAESAMGEISTTSTMTQKVVKVYPNGDADIEAVTTDTVITFAGQEMPAGAEAPKTTTRVDKFGRPVKAENGKTSGPTLDASQFALLGMEDVKELVKGKTFPIESEDANGTTKGTATILDIEGSVVTIKSDVVVKSKQMPDPMNLVTTSKIDAQKNIIIRVDGTIKGGLPASATGGLEITNVTFSMVRL